MGIEIKDFNNPDDQNNNFNNATVDVVKVGDQRMMRITAEPGWKWSNDVKPHVGTFPSRPARPPSPTAPQAPPQPTRPPPNRLRGKASRSAPLPTARWP